ncbi:MAG: hypothetical protein H6582_08300 [Crocinitomicaceae bacterium]|nr:hypothetical protein [Crocinitomicaceae bacterium]
MKLLYRLSFLFLVLCSCKNGESNDLDNYLERNDPPEIMEQIACLKEDGYTHADQMMFTYMIPPKVQKVKDQDHFELSYDQLEEIPDIKTKRTKTEG